MRPVIVDPYKELLNNQLIDDRPDKLANWIPHTSRSKHEKEVDGREYYFVTTHEQIKKDIQNYLFIKAGKYGGNLYGTSVHVVQEVLNSSKHCILDMNGHAIRGLITPDLYSSPIFIKPCNMKWIMDNIREEANEKHARQIYEKSINIKQQFEDVLTVIVEEDTLSDVYDRIFDVIDHEQ
ncbi:unnamed protein product [Rotaria sordida]|uniref:Guanylate kinase-like domain-containing protein n=1 Tax=Rotaria sordida TaxID=392033 RepID=A0A815MCA0_9BILA|nr:unnamed protein product [Rotaria sordida]CAF1531529.1 unnamed protein product [Rotaria sordida]CAF4122943.1 unnamed protein product [Rotaria sordida]CAF4168147.1 unnamed protein product [Rotaria sordida]